MDKQAFSSTFARESAFDEKRWKSRALDPLSNTFAAVREIDTEKETRTGTDRDTGIATDTGRETNTDADKKERVILSLLSLRGPFSVPNDAKFALALTRHLHPHLQSGMAIGMDMGEDNDDMKAPLLRWDVYSVFTNPNVRRQGIGKAVLRAAMEYAWTETVKADANANCVLALGVLDTDGTDGSDGGVRSFYEKAGFTVLRRDEEGGVEMVRCMGKKAVQS